jgi:hypothetical protein
MLVFQEIPDYPFTLHSVGVGFDIGDLCVGLVLRLASRLGYRLLPS